MKFYSLLLLTLFVLGSLQDIVTDTNDFNKEWIRGDAKVKLTWTFSAGTYTFSLNFPEVKTANIKSVLFLRGGASDTFIDAFNPTINTANSVTTYSIDIKETEFDSGNYYCGSGSILQDSVIGVESKTCKGFLAFVHSDNFAVDRSGNYQNSFGAGGDARALVRYDFQVVTKFDLNTKATIGTRVKTKVIALNCEDCKCPENCVLSNAFTITQKVCGSLEACTASGAARDPAQAYFFGDKAYFYFALNPPSRTFQVHQLYSAQPRDGNVESLIDNSYLTTVKSSKGELILSLPMGFVASDVGEALSLKFIFKVDPTARFLEADGPARLLQQPVEAVYTSTPVLHVTKSSTTQGSVSTNGTSTANLQKKVDDLEKISIGAIIVVAFSLLVNLIAVFVLCKK